jgi:hypothetical protein
VLELGGGREGFSDVLAIEGAPEAAVGIALGGHEQIRILGSVIGRPNRVGLGLKLIAPPPIKRTEAGALLIPLTPEESPEAGSRISSQGRPGLSLIPDGGDEPSHDRREQGAQSAIPLSRAVGMAGSYLTTSQDVRTSMSTQVSRPGPPLP